MKMAQRVQVILEDDVDGGPANETVRFSVDGADYEIDLSEKNAQRLRDAIAPWVGHARKSNSRRKTNRTDRGAATDVRAWAKANGMPVNSRGRVPTEVREAYERAMR